MHDRNPSNHRRVEGRRSGREVVAGGEGGGEGGGGGAETGREQGAQGILRGRRGVARFRKLLLL